MLIIKINLVIILGANGVMVSTARTFRDHSTYEKVKFYDKYVFNLKARSHERDLDGILCEQGD